jgi:hypothetical protein
MPLLKLALILAAATGGAVAAMWGLFRLLSPAQPRVAPAGPDPAELMRLEGALAAAEWHVCDSPSCARLETPHHRAVAEFATCSWCGRITVTPAPTAPEGTDA